MIIQYGIFLVDKYFYLINYINMNNNKKCLCIALSILLLFMIFKELSVEPFGNQLNTIIGQVYRKNNPENDIPLYYR
jgi:hypothetical protein|tara:strand:- start:178 stop:408 length:231 start_codon:yes stop_codon:yes gene_type:complete